MASTPKTQTHTLTGSTVSGAKDTRDLFIASSGTSTVFNYGSEDTIQMNVTGSSVIDGTDDVQLTGLGGITLVVKNAKGRTLGISDGSTTSYAYYGGQYTTSPKDVIQSFMGALDETELSGTAALDAAINEVSGGTYTTMAALINAAVSDCSLHGADTFLREDCGIVLGNADTGAISGWDAASSSKSKTGISIVPEDSPKSIDTTFTADSFTTKGLTFKLEKEFSKLTAVQQGIWQGLHTWWAEQSLELIEESYGSDFSFDNADVKTITVSFINKSGGALAAVQNTATNGVVSALELQINMNYYKSVDLDNVNGKSANASAGYLDRTLAHEMTHAIMAATIANFNDLPSYIKEGMAELTHGIDDERGNDISKLAADPSKLLKSLATDTETVSVSGINAPSYAGGYILLRYMANKFASFTSNSSPQTSDSGFVSDEELIETPGALTYNSGRTAVTVTANYTETSLTSATYGDAVTVIDATRASQAISIVGNPSKATTISLGANGGTVLGGAGADKLYGGKGVDVYEYSLGGGSDVIGNTKDPNSLYEEQDKIVVLSTLSAEDAANSLAFKDAKSALTITFKGDKSSKLTVNKKAATTPVTIEFRSPEDDEVITTISHGASIDGVKLNTTTYTAISVGADVEEDTIVDAAAINSQIKIIDATKATVPTYLAGNVQATTISLGSGGGTVTGGYDYVNGKAFNDVFYGGDGADVFVYSVGGGNDQINNYDGRSDKIVLRGLADSISTITASSKSVSYTDKGSNFVLTFVDSNNKKSTLTLNSPLSKVNVYKEGSDDALLSYGVELPDYTGYNKNRTAVTLGASVSDSDTALGTTITVDLVGDGYSDNIKDVDASAFVGTVNLVGNGKTNALKSAIGGGTLEGGYDAEKSKATGDKLYGNAGSDVFVYRLVKGIGGGSDVIGGDAKFSIGNYQEHDAVYITSGTGLSKADLTITDKNNSLVLKFNGDSKSQLTINKASDSTPVTFFLGDSDTALEDITDSFTYGVMPEGAAFGKKNDKTDYTTLVLASTLEADNNIDVSNINSQIKTIDSTKATVSTYIVGNANANAVSLGAYGGTVDGGAGNDKIYGNAATTASTTFVYTLGDGNDEINYFNGSKDTIFIGGYTKAISASDKSVFKDSGKDITLTLTSGTTKGKLTIKSVTGELKVIGEDADGNAITLLDYGKNLPDSTNMIYNSGKTAMTIGSAAELDGVDTFKVSDYGINLKEINAAPYSSTALHLIAADGKANILRAGSADSTLEGGTGKDKLYGNSGSDTFVYSVKTGSGDEIYSLDGSQGDEIILLGYSKDTINTSDSKQFTDNGKDINLVFDGTKLVLKNPTGQLNVYKGSLDDDGNIVKGDAVLSYDQNLPEGLDYNVGKTTLTFKSSIDGGTDDYTVDASVKDAYSVKLTTIDASIYGGAVELVGNDANNVLYASKGGSTLNGGKGGDKLYGGAGSDTFIYNNDGSKDVVYNFDATADVIKVDAPSKAGGLLATYNGKTLVLSYTDKNGNVTINGKETDKKNKYAELDTSTTISIQIGDDEVHTYQFVDTKMKNVALSASIDSKYAIVDGGVDDGDADADTDTDTDADTNEMLAQAPGSGTYWFEETVDDAAQSNELGEIITAAEPIDFAVDTLDFNELNKKFDHALGTNSAARHRFKK